MTAQTILNEYVLHPAHALWMELSQDTQNAFTTTDLTNYVWNSFICFIPLATGGGAAFITNGLLHHFIPENLPGKRILSFICTTACTLLGVAVSLFAVKFFTTYITTLAPFTADKAIQLETFNVVLITAVLPILHYFQLPSKYLIFSMTFGAPAVAGYFGTRSLYVLGALSALQGAVHSAVVQAKPGESLQNS